jgi:fructose transport system ATP-binding protein
MPEVFAIADRIHIHRLGRRAAMVSTKTTAMSDVVATMTGALPSDAVVSTALAPAGRPGF